jgi:hypothetical protein
MKSKTIGTVAVTLFALLSASGALAQKSGVKPAASTSIAAGMLVQTISTVQSVDPATRRVTIVDALGHRTQLDVGQQMSDVSQLPIGSRVQTGRLQPVMLTPVKASKLDEMVPGDKQFVAEVTSADPKSGVVMLRDAINLPIEVRTRDPHKAAMLPSGSTVKVMLTGEQQ